MLVSVPQYMLPCVAIMKSGTDWLRSPGKRSFDLLLVAGMLPPAVLLGGAALAVVAAENGWPPFFLQERVGRNPTGPLLRIPKFRTLAGPVDHQASPAGHNHARAAGIMSAWIRRVHLDEVPQLWPVLAGDMSVVGPRPIVPIEYDQVMDSLNKAERKKWLTARSACKPGLISRLSVSQHLPGYANDPRKVAESDIAYLEKASLAEDIKTVLKVAEAVSGDLSGVRI